MEPLLIIVIVVALAFDFTNGFHDTANAIATIVSTKALSPKVAVIGAAILNFLGAFISVQVAATIAGDIVDPSVMTLQIVLAGLVGAIIWNLITWRMGLPSSSSHALVGGILGSAIISTGFDFINWQGLEQKIVIPSLISPVAGLIIGALIMLAIFRVVRRYKEAKVNKFFQRAQLVSGGFVALMHGTNDAQKTMGIIALALITVSADKTFHIPLWVIVASATSLAAGTYIGGWRIINTMGEKITKLLPPQGFAAQSSTAMVLGVTAHFGLPVSTTHTISGSIVGAGAATSLSAVNWRIIKSIGVAWLVTIPCAAAIGAGAELIAHLPHGTGILLLVAAITVGFIYITRNWTRKSQSQVKTLLGVLGRHRLARANENVISRFTKHSVDAMQTRVNSKRHKKSRSIKRLAQKIFKT